MMVVMILEEGLQIEGTGVCGIARAKSKARGWAGRALVAVQIGSNRYGIWGGERGRISMGLLS